MFNLNVFYRFLAIKLELVNIHTYANQLICIFELYAKGQCCSFNMIPKGRSHMRPRMDFHLVLHGEYI